MITSFIFQSLDLCVATEIRKEKKGNRERERESEKARKREKEQKQKKRINPTCGAMDA